MTYSPGPAAFSRTVRIGAILAATGLLSAGGCASTNTGTSEPAALAAGGTPTGPNDTGTYPNLNIPPQVAAPQFTPSQTKAKLAELTADKGDQKGGPPPKIASDAAMLKLARTHGGDALKQIEGKCDPTLDPTCK